MGTGSLFQFKLLGNWEKVVSEAKVKAEDYNEKLKAFSDRNSEKWKNMSSEEQAQFMNLSLELRKLNHRGPWDQPKTPEDFIDYES